MYIAYVLADVVKTLKKMGVTVMATLAAIALIIFMICSTSDASEYHSNYEKIPAVNKTPVQVGKWSLTPTVIVCEYAPVTETQIDAAVSFWKKLGHRFYSTQFKHDPLRKCLEPNPMGYIVVHLVKQGIKMEPSSLAETHFYVDNDSGKISWAIIYVRNDLRETVLEHEIGHALGFLHHNKINHLMNSKWTQGGWDTDGLKNK